LIANLWAVPSINHVPPLVLNRFTISTTALVFESTATANLFMASFDLSANANAMWKTREDGFNGTADNIWDADV